MARAEVQFKTNFISFLFPSFLDQVLTDHPESLNTKNVVEGGGTNIPFLPTSPLKESRASFWIHYNNPFLILSSWQGLRNPTYLKKWSQLRFEVLSVFCHVPAESSRSAQGCPSPGCGRWHFNCSGDFTNPENARGRTGRAVEGSHVKSSPPWHLFRASQSARDKHRRSSVTL